MSGIEETATHFTAAAVQASPVFLDLEASVEKACSLIEEAAARGAKLIGFPEGFLPGHPAWVELLPFDSKAQELARRLFLASVEVPGPAVRKLCATAAAHHIDVVMGICQRRPATTGTLFNAQLHVDASGSIAGLHQKYVPTVGERLVHAPGATGFACSFRASVGMVSGLICGENSNPLAQYAAAVGYPLAHVAAWPPHFSPELDMGRVVPLVSSALAYSLKTHVIAAVGTVSDDMVAAYGGDHETFLRGCDARAAIFGPDGGAIAQASSRDEQLVYATIDPLAAIVPKFVHDVAGHYTRPELFRPLLEQSTT